jgi:DNA-binding IclR family transcriptional regulator
MSGRPDIKSLNHVARVIALQRARRMGWLEGRSLQEIGAELGVNRSTVMRNLRDLDEIEALAEEYLTALGPKIITKAPA